jgi:hypothetical protein
VVAVVPPNPRAQAIIDRAILYSAAVSEIWSFRIWGGFPSRKLVGSKIWAAAGFENPWLS